MTLVVVNRSESQISQKNLDPIIIDSGVVSDKRDSEVSKKISKPILTDSTSLKIALYWTGVSLVIISASTLSRFSSWYCITALGTFPLLFPLCLHIKILALNVRHLLPILQKMQIIALWTLFGIIQLGIGYRVIRQEALSSSLSTIFATSIGSCSFVLFMGHNLWDKKVIIVDLREKEYADLKKYANYLENQIEKIDRFIKERPHLKSVVEDHIHKYGKYIGCVA